MSGKRVRAGRGRDLVSDGNQTKYIINFIIKFISGFEKEMCQNAVAENVEREKKNCATVHPHQKYLAFIPLSKSQTKTGPSCSTSLLLSFGFFVAFSTYFAMYFLLFV